MNYTTRQITDKSFSGLRLLNPDCYHDFRGYYWTIHKDEDAKFNHDKLTVSKKDVLRGIHGDFSTTKMITCVYGEVYVVLVDKRRGSRTFNEWRWLMLSHLNRKGLIIPPGIGLSYLVVSEEASVLYKLSYEGEYQDVDDQFTFKWDDPDIGIDWPINNPILQKRDK